MCLLMKLICRGNKNDKEMAYLAWTCGIFRGFIISDSKKSGKSKGYPFLWINLQMKSEKKG